MKLAGFVPVAVLAFTVVGCSDSSMPTAPTLTPSVPAATPGGGAGTISTPTIAGIATGNADFSTLVKALSKAGLVQTFSGPGAFTVFAPTNAAFDAAAAALLGPGSTGVGLVDALDVATLTAVLKYHVVGDARTSQAVLASSALVMLDGNSAAVSLKNGAPYLQNARIVATDLQASNGVVHVIDAVILPPGVGPTPAAATPTIAAIAAGNPAFSTLVSALAKAGLVATFNGTQRFTVFAPTNAAFDEAAKQLHYRNGVELVASLDVKTLTAILTYHVIPGDVLAKDVVAADQLHMLSGVAADVSLRNGQAFIDGARIATTDLAAANGVIHVIDAVMLPFGD